MTSWVRPARAIVAGALLTAALCVTSACSVQLTGSSPAEGGAAPTGSGATTTAAPVPYDVRPWLSPSRKFLGVAVNGVPRSLAPAKAFGALVGKQPNLLAFYVAWGDQLSVGQAHAIWDSGALPYMAWEPFSVPLSKIAGGASDMYIREFAAEVRTLQVPIAISFGHEMNGFWYPWGTKSTNARNFVKAWRHVHDLFQNVGATNVIWVWSPNVVNPMPQVALKPYYPGNGYVDWVGVVGYYARTGAHTFGTLYGPTFDEIHDFSDKPILIAETGSQPGARKPHDIDDLFAGVARHHDVLGFIWFNIAKDTDWRVDTSKSALEAFRRDAAGSEFGFDARHP